MKKGLNRVKKSPVTTTRGQVAGSRARGSDARRSTNAGSSAWNLWSDPEALAKPRQASRKPRRLPGVPATRKTCSISTRMSPSRAAVATERAKVAESKPSVSPSPPVPNRKRSGIRCSSMNRWK